MFEDVFTCGNGLVRNPSSARCVRTSRSLGRAIKAAAEALRRGEVPSPCTAGAYNFSRKECVSQAAIAKALAKMHRESSGADKNTRLISKLLASQALSRSAYASNLSNARALAGAAFAAKKETNRRLKAALNQKRFNNKGAGHLEREVARLSRELRLCQQQRFMLQRASTTVP